MNLPAYVVITPARNEVEFIGLTLQSVVAQTIRPLKWVIVSDGSTDGTDDLVQWYATRNSWIELVRMPERRERHFAGKVHAFNAGYDRVRHLPFEVIASLDADISFGPDYIEFLLDKLAADPELGLAGTPFLNNALQSYDYRFVSIEHVSGACQVFRRECFEQIGGYVPVKGGGIDHIAVITARMKGWKTRTFVERHCLHHRTMGTAEHSVLMARFRTGAQDYALGSHPLWHLSRTVHQMTRKPFLLGGLALGAGYFQAMLRRSKRSVSRELMEFRRREQMQRLKQFISRRALIGARKDSLIPTAPR
jgi:poly-beta-1,6-N-acetyl-D-glucosamine synthase